DAVAGSHVSNCQHRNAGDTDGDGWDELLVVGALSDLQPYRRTFLFAGPFSGDLAPTDAAATLTMLTPPTSDHPSDLAGVGDVDDDGLDDIALSLTQYVDLAEPGNADDRNGIVAVVRGPVAGDIDLATQSNATITGRLCRWEDELGDAHEEMSTFGQAVAGGGDLNADGIDDLVIGSPWGCVFPWNGSQVGPPGGEVYVFFGPVSGNLLAEDADVVLHLDGEQGFETGSSIAGVGDVNGDGFDDLMAKGDAVLDVPGLWGASYLLLGRWPPESSSRRTSTPACLPRLARPWPAPAT
ncbi:MAG: hypothetical protein GY898_16345, partial [Proteobacteria bacterium]|nr:hypothetical protein [Pseudomonadota bacterium]